MMKEKMDKLDFIKIKNFFLLSRTPSRNGKDNQPTELENRFADHISDMIRALQPEYKKIYKFTTQQ